MASINTIINGSILGFTIWFLIDLGNNRRYILRYMTIWWIGIASYKTLLIRRISEKIKYNKGGKESNREHELNRDIAVNEPNPE